MHHLQTRVLTLYKQEFPKDTLKDISTRTGIQITRVFRLFNGSEMKLKEYMAFEKCLKSHFSRNDFLELTHECLLKLSKRRLQLLIGQMNQSLKLQYYQQKQYTKPLLATTELA
ncbi:MAG: hypothetical protein QF441_01770 [Bacteriovoracaceae bacterium]|jgi:hypothetical protein|nr:hypothetical protein [Bacteriovoracaceae bacterium]|tara:strand:- start:456 stop:797 length:342 start_codon:yes stop_codon:yes gene_type:complete